MPKDNAATKEERIAALANSDLSELEEGNEQAAPAKRTDPGIDITEEQARRIEQVVDDHTREALAELTNLRDRSDALMHTLRDADTEVKTVVHNYARKVAKTVKAKVLIAKALEEIEKEFAVNGAPANTVISQQK